jgi:L-threonylcarbamoyladenylate synthase
LRIESMSLHCEAMTQRLAPDQWLPAANILKHGGTVAFPTETVYGLGADATRSTSIEAIFRAKGRPSDNPLIVHLHHPDQLDDYCQSIPSLAFELIAKFCPGPLTLVLGKKPSIVSSVTAGLDTVAVRFPSHPTAQRILEAADLPIAAPSANRSGSPSATSWQAVLEDLDGRIDAVVCDGAAAIGVESTVLDLSSLRPVILRHGAITLEQLREIEPSVTLHATVASNQANSPGLRHRHYQPRAQVVLCDAQNDATAQANLSLISNNAAAQEARNAFIGLSEPDSSQRFEMQLRCSDIEEYARSLFDFFRRCDAHDIKRIYCERVEEIGLGRAVMDRLRRASESR